MSADTQKKLLIIDDEENIVELMQQILERKGFITFGATDGEKGVELYKKQKPDATLIDIYMPDSSLSGLGVLKTIKETDKDAACIMLTYMGGEDIVEQCKRLGADHYIRKPVEVDTLVKSIKEVLKGSKETSNG